jgi:hypothetical protein
MSAKLQKIDDDLIRRLHQDAKKYPLSKIKPKSPEPKLAADASDEQVIDATVGKDDGVVIGGNHQSSSANEFLINNMGNLRRNGVDTLYVEGFDPYMQKELDAFLGAPDAPMSDRLKDFVDAIDRKWALRGAGNYYHPYKLMDVLYAARANKMRVVGIEPPVEGMVDRVNDFNYYGTRKIQEDRKGRPPGSKFVVFVGAYHSSPTSASKRGIADALGVRSINIKTGNYGSRTVESGKGTKNVFGSTRDDSGKVEYQYGKPDIVINMRPPFGNTPVSERDFPPAASP